MVILGVEVASWYKLTVIYQRLTFPSRKRTNLNQETNLSPYDRDRELRSARVNISFKIAWNQTRNIERSLHRPLQFCRFNSFCLYKMLPHDWRNTTPQFTDFAEHSIAACFLLNNSPESKPFLVHFLERSRYFESNGTQFIGPLRSRKSFHGLSDCKTRGGAPLECKHQLYFIWNLIEGRKNLSALDRYN